MNILQKYNITTQAAGCPTNMLTDVTLIDFMTYLYNERPQILHIAGSSLPMRSGSHIHSVTGKKSLLQRHSSLNSMTLDDESYRQEIGNREQYLSQLDCESGIEVFLDETDSYVSLSHSPLLLSTLVNILRSDRHLDTDAISERMGYLRELSTLIATAVKEEEREKRKVPIQEQGGEREGEKREREKEKAMMMEVEEQEATVDAPVLHRPSSRSSHSSFSPSPSPSPSPTPSLSHSPPLLSSSVELWTKTTFPVLECVFLNACNSNELGLHLVQGGIPVVICWSSLSLPQARLVFSRSFYRSLSGDHSRNYQRAFHKAIKSMKRNGYLPEPVSLSLSLSHSHSHSSSFSQQREGGDNSGGGGGGGDGSQGTGPIPGGLPMFISLQGQSKK